MYSRAGVSQVDRDGYVLRLARTLRKALEASGALRGGCLETVYFGGGSPALCDLTPLLDVLSAARASDGEFTVELHPLDVTDGLLARLKDGGVNRISMGVQSLDDATLRQMGRGHTLSEAQRAFARIRRHFDNAGIDLIVGYPGDACADWMALRDWGLRHCSVYSLMLEEKSILHRQLRQGGVLASLPTDDEVLDRIAAVQGCLAGMGLARYEISNYAQQGRECRHNLAVWRGEDYWGLGAGAFGRVGLRRTENWGASADAGGLSPAEETVTAEQDHKERTVFRLRTRDGLEAKDHPQWESVLAKFVAEGLLTRSGTVYRLTARGTEVCDTILAELV